MNKKILLIVAIGIWGIGLFAQIVPDDNFRYKINQVLGKPYNYEPTIADLNGLTGTLSAQNANIESIQGAQHLTNLTFLDLWGNHISDISVLSGLTNLECLRLPDNQICDISILSYLTNLTELYLDENQIIDISALSNLTNLFNLSFWGNQVSDISVLSGLTNIQYLRMNHNPISDISALSNLTNLLSLELYNNQIRDISQLSGLTNLESLQLYSNQISDISPLSRLTNLEFLKLYENQISNISAISELTNLRVLDLHNNQISDISPISGLTNLDHLYLSENQINNIYDLFRLTNLISLSLHGNQITDISSLVTNTGLGIFDHLWLDYSESTNPLSSEAMEIHIPILLAREFDLFTSPEVANQNTACYPFPNRDTDNIGYGSKLFWYGAESGTEYEVYLGSSEENLISIGEGEYIDESTFTISPELLPNTEYWWRVKSTTGEEELWSGMWHFTTGKNLTSVAKTTLYSAYPNPFNPSTTLSFSIGNEQNQQNQQIGLEIFNIKGQKVKTLDCINNIDAVTTPALVTYSIVWNGKDDYNQPVSSGVYFYKLKSKSTTQVRKMLLLK